MLTIIIIILIGYVILSIIRNFYPSSGQRGSCGHNHNDRISDNSPGYNTENGIFMAGIANDSLNPDDISHNGETDSGSEYSGVNNDSATCDTDSGSDSGGGCGG